MSIRIVADSASDLFSLEGVDYTTVPLKVRIGDTEYVDDGSVDTQQMMEHMRSEKTASTTSCPNVQEWISAFAGSEEVFCITISGALSASYESCCLAADHYREQHPDAKIHIFDSKGTGAHEAMIIRHLAECIKAGMSFDETLKDTLAFYDRIHILYIIASLDNLAKNGRVSASVAKLTSLLGIRVVGRATPKGEIDIFAKKRGEKQALVTVVREMEKFISIGPNVCIDHVLNPKGAKALADLVCKTFENVRVTIAETGALCTYYADMGGLILSFEEA
jgi:DegV family protein with EDD domain